jgi:hypothetical protein
VAAGGSIVQKAALVKTPGRAIMQVEKAIRTVILTGKIIAVGFRDQLCQLLVRHLVKLVWRYGLAYAPAPGFHFIPFVSEVFEGRDARASSFN